MLKYKDAKEFADSCRQEGKRIGFTNGCFDIIHPGHIDYIIKAASMCDVFIMGLNTDSSVKRLKGDKRPINDEKFRSLVISGIKGVNKVFLFDEDTPYDLINAIKPDMLFKGGDYTVDNIVGADIVRDNGGIVQTIPFLEGYSSTDVINRIKEL